MAKATFVKSAQKDIYARGKRVEYKSEKGKRAGQTLSKIDKTIPADETDTVIIAKGESYYWWQFMHSPKQYSKTMPKPSQLTQSAFMSTLYSIQEEISECDASTPDEFNEFRDSIASQIEELKDETQNSLDNMPESLQYSPTGELLQERIDALENWQSEVEGIECDCDEDEIRSEVQEEMEGELDEGEELNEAQIEENIAQKVQEKVQESIEELQGTDCGL